MYEPIQPLRIGN